MYESSTKETSGCASNLLAHEDLGHPQNALGLREQASWMHSHLVPFVELSYTYSFSASVAWQSLLTHIDIY